MTDSDSRPNSKVARVINTYELDGMGDHLEAQWTGTDGDRTSLRDLADVFNQSVLRAAMREARGSTIESDVMSTYATLTEDDAPAADRMRKRRELEQAGINVDTVLDDFVTHQAIHTYLKRYRGAELPDRSTDRIKTIERLQGRTAAVAESTIESFINAGELSDHDYDVLVDVRAVCSDCRTDYALVDLLRQGGCDCQA